MAVQTKQGFTRREYDFGNLQLNGATELVVVTRSTDISYGEKAELVVRVHDSDVAAACDIKVRAVPIKLTPEEPDVDYLSGSAVATVTIDSSTTAPALMIDAFDAPFGDAVQIQVLGHCGSGSSVPIKATISAQIVCKD